MVVQLFLDMLDLLAQRQSVSLCVKKLEMTTEEVARFLGVSRSLIRREIERGRLKFRKTDLAPEKRTP
jgi:IS30 family transposase